MGINQTITTIPIFDDIKWELNNGKELIIKKEGDSRKFKSVEINGEIVDGYFVPYSIFEKGGTIVIETKK